MSLQSEVSAEEGKKSKVGYVGKRINGKQFRLMLAQAKTPAARAATRSLVLGRLASLNGA